MSAIDYSFFPTGWIKYPEEKTWDRYKHYVRDKTLVQYGASLINTAIGSAADKVVASINDLSSTIQSVGDKVCLHLTNIEEELSSLNRRADMLIEQQRITNMLLQNIIELLKIPNSEKERQQAITQGLRFFVNAKIDSSLYSDALEEFLKAESYQKQDYFVLHRIGCIYLYSEENLAPDKAMEYFARAAKYSKIESNPDALRVANILTNPITLNYSQTIVNTNSIQYLAADSYEKAAFAAYVINDLANAIQYQQASNSLRETPQGLFLLSKYYAHESDISKSLPLLSKSIDADPRMASAVFQEVDMMIQSEIINYIDQKDNEVNEELNTILNYLEGKMNTSELVKVREQGSFAERMNTMKRYKRRLKM